MPGTGVGSRWLDCLSFKLQTSLLWINAAKAEVSSKDVPGTGVGSSWLVCQTFKLHTFLFWINAAKAEVSS